jgi:hypothetical protein
MNMKLDQRFPTPEDDTTIVGRLLVLPAQPALPLDGVLAVDLAVPHVLHTVFPAAAVEGASAAPWCVLLAKTWTSAGWVEQGTRVVNVSFSVVVWSWVL